MSPKLELIAAACENIGINMGENMGIGDLPWRLKDCKDEAIVCKSMSHAFGGIMELKDQIERVWIIDITSQHHNLKRRHSPEPSSSNGVTKKRCESSNTDASTKILASTYHLPSFYLILEFCEHDLAGLLSNVNVKFSLGEIKNVLKQLLEAVFQLSSRKIMHRDIKSANILVTKNGVLKLADFGLGRKFDTKNDQPNSYTNKVVTLWYRSPELLLGDRNYGPPVDLWGVGCVMAEMWTRTPIIKGNTEQHQLKLISNLCGSITPEVWPDVVKLDLFNKLELPKGRKRMVVDRLKPFVKDPDGCDLLDKLFQLDPSKRINAQNALDHDFFWKGAELSNLSKMLAQHNKSMFTYLQPPRRPGYMPPAQPVPAPTNFYDPLLETGSQDQIY